MKHYLIELYTPNPNWKALSLDERQQFLAKIGTALGDLVNQGVELLTLTEILHDIKQSSTHQFMGIWRFSNPEARQALLDGIETSGWYTYFEHINAGGIESEFPHHYHALLNI